MQSIFIKLPATSEKPTAPIDHYKLDSDKNWVNTLGEFIEGHFWNTKTLNAAKFELVNKNFTSEYTHAGFISYLHYCWAREFGAVLRPDMIFHTIISELASKILSKPKLYNYLFTDSEKKVDIMTFDQLFDYNQLLANFKTLIKNQDFMSTICDTEFDSDVANAKLARVMTFTHMGTPFFNYLCTLCGIPSVRIDGSIDDWMKLRNSIIKLKEFPPEKNQEKHLVWLNTSVNVIDNIIFWAFNIQTEQIKIMFKSKEDFFMNMFHYGKNNQCDSGHAQNLVHGWARHFFDDLEEPSLDLNKFHYHTNYVCMKALNSNGTLTGYFIQMVSLAFSELDEETNTMTPQYGIVTYRIRERGIFNKLAFINEEKKIGENNHQYYEIDDEEIREIIEKGRHYNPAKDHYRCDVTVYCDKCGNVATECYGYIEKDLCMTCYHKNK